MLVILPDRLPYCTTAENEGRGAIARPRRQDNISTRPSSMSRARQQLEVSDGLIQNRDDRPCERISEIPAAG